MFKKILLLSVIIFTVVASNAQQKPIDSVYSKYLDFNLARFQGETDKLLEMGEALLPHADKLPEKTRISFYFAIGQVYENDNQPQKALDLYEKVAAAVPDYYVVHRGIGYIFLTRAIEIHNQAHAESNAATIKKLNEEYEKLARKALPHLEKAQACDPSDETLDYIKTIYKNLKDNDGLNSLDKRLRELSTHCIDILDDK